MAYIMSHERYRDDTRRKSPKPTIKEAKATEYHILYMKVPLPIHVTSAVVSDMEPNKEMKLVAALKKLKLGNAAGASGIQVEDLQLWHKNAHKLEDGDPSEETSEIWEKVLNLISTAFTNGDMPSTLLCNGSLVLIRKDSHGEFRGIALLEIIYELIFTLSTQD